MNILDKLHLTHNEIIEKYNHVPHPYRELLVAWDSASNVVREKLTKEIENGLDTVEILKDYPFIRPALTDGVGNYVNFEDYELKFSDRILNAAFRCSKETGHLSLAENLKIARQMEKASHLESNPD